MGALLLLGVAAASGLLVGSILFACPHRRVFSIYPVGSVQSTWFGRRSEILLYPWICERCRARGIARAEEVLSIGSQQNEERYQELLKG